MEALVHRRAIALALVGMIVAGCQSPIVEPDHGNGPSLAMIKIDPALQLALPASRQVGTIAQDRSETIEGRFPASAGAEFETSSDQATVFAYYERELSALGWRPSRQLILTTIEAAGRAWCKPRMIFRVTIFDPKPAALRGIVIPAGSVRYEAIVLGTEEACPGS
jgi:hypothetical protein